MGNSKETLSYGITVEAIADASAWAKLFCKVLEDNPDILITEEFMRQWFENAMMGMIDINEKHKFNN